MIRWIVGASICSLLCVALMGCNSSDLSTGKVSGQVTMDGKPLPKALVTFSPAAGGVTSTGKTDAEGKYTLNHMEGEGAVIGEHKVSVTTLQEAAAVTEMSSDSADYAKQAMGSSASDYNKAKVVEPIPARYNKDTQLKFEVKSGDNEINIELKAGG